MTDDNNNRIICIVTGSRAEYGLLKPLLALFFADAGFVTRLVVTGAHLETAFGETCREIEDDGFSIHRKLPMDLSFEARSGMAKATGLAIVSFAEYFAENRPDLLLILGDRYEIFAASVAAAMQGIPIAHIAGGDTTEGAVDEFIRHSITKMSYLHFPTNEQSRARIIQMGEDPLRVVNAGSLGIDNCIALKPLSREKLGKELGFDFHARYALVTFHPATLDGDGGVQEFAELLKAAECFSDMNFLFTRANADAGGRAINALLDEFAATHANCKAYASLGSVRYLSAMRYAAMVLGNSSSGLYETPAFGIPCVNIGDRQRGRLRAENVIDCAADAGAIEAAIRKAGTGAFTNASRHTPNPFGEGHAAEKIYNTIKRYTSKESFDLKKTFYLFSRQPQI